MLWHCDCFLPDPRKGYMRILVAEVIRYYLPDLVEMHNYTPANNIQQKKTNWGALNKRVLSHFGLDIPETIIHGLCNGKPGLVEVLLYNLRLKIDEELELQQKFQHSPRTGGHSQMSFESGRTTKATTTLNAMTSRSGRFNKSDGKGTVPRIEFEEIKQRNLQQQEEIEVLHAKIRRLEHVLQLKDIRISELSKTVEDVRPTRPTALKKVK
ncbi:unnamed protein product [Didymodactylos carnosus]|uniref:CH-like domain-containing protein n=1 Tax=Didymodactylos carnosus TaxID=1234261 RepID=A0A813R0V7_9BILA|nr:unnamed protein product [Didymodactylos carnosus]CAF3556838.1 unnamed protein product [Didymodactylos carnosus]